MQPIYTTLSSTGTTPWKLTNWQTTPQQIAFQVISTGGSSWSISGTLEDPTGVYPNPYSSAPTAFTIFTGSSNIFVGLGTSGVPIAAHQFTLNTQSSAGAKVTFVTLQSGIG